MTASEAREPEASRDCSNRVLGSAPSSPTVIESIQVGAGRVSTDDDGAQGTTAPILRAAPQAHFLRHEEATTHWTAEDAGETKIMGFAIGKIVGGLVASLQQPDVGEEGWSGFAHGGGLAPGKLRAEENPVTQRRRSVRETVGLEFGELRA